VHTPATTTGLGVSFATPECGTKSKEDREDSMNKSIGRTKSCLLVGGLALVMAGCSSSTSATNSTTTSPTTSGATIAQRYLSAAEAVDSAYSQWKKAIIGDTSPSQFVGPATTYASQLTTFDNTISDLPASGKVATEIQILVSDDEVVIRDLQSVGSQTQTELTRWGAQLLADGSTAIAAGGTVRSDLGLPPA